MQWKAPKDDSKISWTSHAVMKMRQYGLSEQRVRRVLRIPKRKEEAIVPGLVAVMQPANATAKKKTEIWVMYQIVATQRTSDQKLLTINQQKSDVGSQMLKNVSGQMSRVRVISCWRYPGESLERQPPPIPEDILKEIHQLF